MNSTLISAGLAMVRRSTFQMIPSLSFPWPILTPILSHSPGAFYMAFISHCILALGYSNFWHGSRLARISVRKDRKYKLQLSYNLGPEADTSFISTILHLVKVMIDTSQMKRKETFNGRRKKLYFLLIYHKQQQLWSGIKGVFRIELIFYFFIKVIVTYACSICNKSPSYRLKICVAYVYIYIYTVF